MMIMKKEFSGLVRSALIAVGVLGYAVTISAATSIADEPIFGGDSGVKPNIMVLMDTSNSMSWTHMPDQLEQAGAKQSIGYKSSSCNALYYDPTRTYKRPRDGVGAYLPIPSFSAAPYDYYLNPSVMVDLGSNFQAHDAATVSSVLSLPDTPQPAYYYVYTGPAATFSYNTAPCNTIDTGASSGNWVRKIVSSTSGIAARPDERENFAIWYTYYRTRIALSKSAMGQAFSPLTDRYRVGFITANPTLPSTGAPSSSVLPERYLGIADFDASQRVTWYSKLYGQQPGGSSPTREGLARVGRHYGGKSDGINTGMTGDPVVNACQPNFTILTTDGYWNTEAEKSNGGPVQLDSTTWVGQQDNPWTPDSGLNPFGIYDGGASQIGYTKYVKRTTNYRQANCTLQVNGQFTRKITKTLKKFEQKTTTPAGGTPGAVEMRQVRNVQRTWNATKTTTRDQQTTTTTTQTTTRYVWYNPATEQETFVGSCLGLAGCSPSITHATVSSCSPQTGDAGNGYTTIACNTATATVGVPTGTCVASANVTCNTVTTGPSPATGAECSSAGTTNLGGYLYRTCTITNDVTQNVATCGGNDLSTPGSSSQCSTIDTGWLYQSSGACTPAAADVPPYVFTQCRTGGVCVPSAANNYCAPVVTTSTGYSCIPQAPSAANGYSTTTCTQVTISGPTVVDPATCSHDPTPTAANNWVATYCGTVDSAAVVAESCVAQAASQENGWTATICTGNVNTPGLILQSSLKTTTTLVYQSGATIGPTDSTSVWSNVGGETCKLPANATVVPGAVVTDDPPVVVATTSGGGSLNSLADVAQYYYKTDLRPSMPDVVRPGGSGWGDDRATWQHMTTYVVGLGVSGTVNFQDDYMTAATGDFAQIRAGTKAWPVWPAYTASQYAAAPKLYNDARSIDDFWHTAVNGRGRYFNANNPDNLVSGIRGALNLIDAVAAVGAGRPFSNPLEPGESFATSYVSKLWTGDLRSVDVNTSTTTWSAKTQLNGQVQADCDNRKIYYRSSTGALAPFTWDTKNCSSGSVSTGLGTSLQALMDNTGLSQYVDMTDGTGGTINQRTQATGKNLVNFLRGQRQHEDFASGVSGKLYRKRDALLGDMIGSKPVYVQKAKYDYSDAGYHSFKAGTATRKGMVYVGANDGMLHAFYAPAATDTNAADGGKEAWAYIPRPVMANLPKLADVNYGSNHVYFVDGSPVVGDVKGSTGWHTILVGGLNAGGKGYYALDVTDPENPSSLWEFDSSSACTPACDVGLSFGKPIIGKLKNGTWAVFLTSGYNNSSGKGKLYVLNALTGQLISQISTNQGSSMAPSGLAKVSSFVDFQRIDNTVERLYGGDLLGNIWRFDVNDAIAPTGLEAALIGTATSADGTPQAITTPPYLGVWNRKNYIFVGTGKLLSHSDLTSTQLHSIYGVIDPMSPGVVYSDLRGALKKFTATSGLEIQCAETAEVCDAENTKGWLADFSVNTGEQVNVDMVLAEGTLIVGTNQPIQDTCSTDARGRIYYVNPTVGSSLGAGVDLVNKALVGIELGLDSSGNVVSYLYDNKGGVTQANPPQPFNPQGSNRMSWRELTGK